MGSFVTWHFLPSTSCLCGFSFPIALLVSLVFLLVFPLLCIWVCFFPSLFASLFVLFPVVSPVFLIFLLFLSVSQCFFGLYSFSFCTSLFLELPLPASFVFVSFCCQLFCWLPFGTCILDVVCWTSALLLKLAFSFFTLLPLHVLFGLLFVLRITWEITEVENLT